MFNKLALLAFVAPLVSSLTLNPPNVQVVSAQSLTVTWTHVPSDRPFSLVLSNEQFRDTFAIESNVVPELDTLTVTLPVLPAGGGYTLRAIEIGNVNNILSETSQFSVVANSGSTTSSGSSTSSAASSSASSTSRSVTSSSSTTRLSTTSSGFGTTVTSPRPSSTAASSGASSSGSGTSGAQASSTNAAMSTVKAFSFNMGGVAAVLLSAVAGAAFVL